MSNTEFPSVLPIIQAPMAGVQDSALTIAVSSAGGLGSLACAMLSDEKLVNELERIKSSGIGAYNLNFFSHQPPQPDERRERRWRDALASYYHEYGIDPSSIERGPGRVPFSEKILDVITPYRPPVVSFHFGLPDPSCVAAIQSWGGQIWSSATTVAEARWLADHGADAVIAQGIEAGGHRGMFLSRDLSKQRDRSALVFAIQQEISLPVIATGGIASPQEVESVMAAGAWAVQIGTAYLCCNEAKTSPLHRALVHSPKAQQTQLTNVFSGGAARGITNRLMSELGPMSDLAPEFPLASNALAPLRLAAEAQGKGDFSPLWCGSDTSGCREVSAGEQTRWLAEQLG